MFVMRVPNDHPGQLEELWGQRGSVALSHNKSLMGASQKPISLCVVHIILHAGRRMYPLDPTSLPDKGGVTPTRYVSAQIPGRASCSNAT